MLEARALLAGSLLSVACAATNPAPLDAPVSAPAATEIAGTEDAGAGSEAADGASVAADVGLTIERVEPPLGGTRLATKVGDCTLTLTIEKMRMDWRTAPSSGECAVLAPGSRATWVALARRARSEASLPEKLYLVIDFRGDEASVESWFRHQAASDDLQKLASKHQEVAYYETLARRMRESGSLSRYAELLGAMGFDIEGVSVEKVEVMPAATWRQRFPSSAEWKLPAKSRLALPNLTLLQLRPK
jgi:hypothetical protein